jgi:hypothetical protein
MQSDGMKRGRVGNGASGAVKMRVSPAGVQARKHVNIEIEEEKENVGSNAKELQSARDVKGKGKVVVKGEEVDFHALMDGMDWEEDAGWSSSQPSKKEVKVSVDATSLSALDLEKLTVTMAGPSRQAIHALRRRKHHDWRTRRY